MKARGWILFVALAAAAAGVYLSDKLLAKHMHMGGTPAWMDALCQSGDSATVSCDKVLASPWGMFPPIREGEPQHKQRLPVALIGMGYFTVVFTWLLAVGRANHAGRRWHLVPLLINAAGLAGSIGFIKIMAVNLDTWCPLCLAVHGINLVLFVANVLLYPRKPRQVQQEEGAPTSAVPAGYPSWRLAVIVLVLALALAQLEVQLVSVKALKVVNTKLAATMEEIRSDVNAMINMHMSEAQQTIALRPDDPVRHRADNVPTLVVWSDFECQSCRKFAQDFEQTYFDAFRKNIQVVYKHFPINSDCNPYAQRRTHPAACDMARLAEAFRLVGGNDPFWKAHDVLFAAQETGGELNVNTLAEQVGLDPERVIAAMNSDMVAQRIAEDIEQGHRLGVNSTPIVFLNGRLINNWARGVENFWKGLGLIYNMNRSAASPPASRPP